MAPRITNTAPIPPPRRRRIIPRTRRVIQSFLNFHGNLMTSVVARVINEKMISMIATIIPSPGRKTPIVQRSKPKAPIPTRFRIPKINEIIAPSNTRISLMFLVPFFFGTSFDLLYYAVIIAISG